MSRFSLNLVSAVLLAVFAFSSRAEAVDLSKVRFNGYIDVEYTVSDSPEGNENGSFHQHHLSFLLDIPVDDKTSARTQIEFDHGVDTTFGNGDIIVEYSFIEYIFNDSMQFRIGKIATPFGYYNELHDATPTYLSVFIPNAINKSSRRGGNNMFPGWNTGASMLGTLDVSERLIDYIVYVGNGENRPNVNEAEDDENRNKAFGGRVNFWATEFFQLGASFYTGEKAVSSSKLAEPHTSYGILGALSLGKINAMAEYVESRLLGATETGAYLQLSYAVDRRYTPYFRVEYSDPSNKISNDTWTEYLGGLNIKITENLIFKAEGASHHRGKNNTSVIRQDKLGFNELRLALTMFF